MLEAALLVVSGIFLMTPGILTDTAGFLMVYRPIRERMVPYIIDRIRFSVKFEVRRI
jgi:UPF0716 family protein affecting phage T7 exclusion